MPMEDYNIFITSAFNVHFVMTNADCGDCWSLGGDCWSWSCCIINSVYLWWKGNIGCCIVFCFPNK